MPTCPLCESSQPAGESCDVCGRAFPAGQRIPVPVAPLPDLEATRHAAVAHGPMAPLPELEPTAQRGGAAVTPERVEGFSPTAAEAVSVEVVQLEVERVGDGAAAAAPWMPGPVVCRYCHAVAAAGQRLCASCGMRLPVERTAAAAAALAPRPCRDCGIPMTGSQCPACGARRGGLR